MTYITTDQLFELAEIADELERLAQTADHIGSPAAYHLKQMDRALPENVVKLRALIAAVRTQTTPLEARF